MATTTLPPVVVPHDGFFEEVGDFFENIFHAKNPSDLYNKLTDAEKAAAVWGSGLIAVINHNIDALPPVLIDLIKTKFPALNLDVVHGFLDTLRSKVDNLQSAIPLTLEDALIWAQKYFKQYTGSVWGIIASAAASIISTLLSPGTAIEKFIAVSVEVYQSIVRPHVTGQVATA